MTLVQYKEAFSTEKTVTIETHTSNGLRFFLEKCREESPNYVLDAGPIFGSNIERIAPQTSRFYIHDLFLGFREKQKNGRPGDSFWELLDYPPNCFRGILLWHLLDHFEIPDGEILAQVCEKLLSANGLIFMTTLDVGASESQKGGYVLGSDDSLRFCPLASHQALPRHQRPIRGLIDIFHHMTTTKSFLYRNGVREVVMQKTSSS